MAFRGVEVVGECAAGGREHDGPERVGGVAKKVLEGFDVDGVGFECFSEDILELVDFVVDFERVFIAQFWRCVRPFIKCDVPNDKRVAFRSRGLLLVV